jgi:hypothetical protein
MEIAKAILFKTSGMMLDATPKNGKTYTLKEMQSMVNGLIQVIDLSPAVNALMVMNEEGKLLELPLNVNATRIFRMAFEGTDDFVVGDVLICKKNQMN